jgi:hypothetical protein
MRMQRQDTLELASQLLGVAKDKAVALVLDELVETGEVERTDR